MYVMVTRRQYPAVGGDSSLPL